MGTCLSSHVHHVNVCRVDKRGIFPRRLLGLLDGPPPIMRRRQAFKVQDYRFNTMVMEFLWAKTHSHVVISGAIRDDIRCLVAHFLQRHLMAPIALTPERFAEPFEYSKRVRSGQRSRGKVPPNKMTFRVELLSRMTAVPAEQNDLEGGLWERRRHIIIWIKRVGGTTGTRELVFESYSSINASSSHVGQAHDKGAHSLRR